MALPIVFTETGRETLRALDISVQRRVKAALKRKLANTPTLGKRLFEPLVGFLSFSVGDYRVIYTYDRTQLIVYRVGHRDHVYELMTKQVGGSVKEAKKNTSSSSSINTMNDLRRFAGVISEETGERMMKHIRKSRAKQRCGRRTAQYQKLIEIPSMTPPSSVGRA